MADFCAAMSVEFYGAFGKRSKVEEAKAEAEEAKAKEMEADVNAPVESQAGGSTKTEPVLAVSDVSADKVGPDATNAVEKPAHA